MEQPCAAGASWGAAGQKRAQGLPSAASRAHCLAEGPGPAAPSHAGFMMGTVTVMALADAAEENQDSLSQSFGRLSSATRLLLLLLRLGQKLSVEQAAILEAALLPLQDTPDLGWVETADAAISHLLKTCLSRSSKEQVLNLGSQLDVPRDTSRLKKHIALLCDRLAKGGRLCLSADTATVQPTVMPGGCATIPESDLEDPSGERDSTELLASPRHLVPQAPEPEVSSLHEVLEP